MTERPGLLLPPALSPGDLIGVAAPAGPFPTDRFEEGLARLESLDFHTLVPPGIYRKTGFLAGPDDDRAAILNQLTADDRIGAIIGARGGYGSMRILDAVDNRRLRGRPKILLGFSDLTALLLDVHRTTGLVTFHGPVVTSLADADDETLTHLRRLLTGRPVFPLSFEPSRIFHSGSAQGPLAGGNLSMIVHLLAAGRLPDLEGAVLFIEDVGEPPYRVDRMLTTLKMAGFLDRTAGLLFGRFLDCGPDDEVLDVIERALDGYRGPAAAGFPIGHGPRNLALPIGPRAVFDADSGVLDVTEPYLAD